MCHPSRGADGPPIRIIPTSLSLLALLLVPAALADGGSAVKSLRGTVASLTQASVAVRDGERTLTCGLGADAPAFTGIGVGDRVAITCRRARAGLVLVSVSQLPPRLRLVEIDGTVVTAGPTSLTVEARGGRRLTCVVPSTLAIAAGALVPGDVVGAHCGRRGDAELTLLRLRKQPVESGKPVAGPITVDIAGPVAAVDTTRVTVTNEDRTMTCAVTTATATAAASLTVGLRVAMTCRDGAIVALAKKTETPTGAGKGDEGAGKGPTVVEPAPAPIATMTFGFRGPVTSVSPDRIFVTTDGGSRSCFVPEALRSTVAAVTVGAMVRITCAGVDLVHAQLTAIERI